MTIFFQISSKLSVLVIFFSFLMNFGYSQEAKIDGELKKWHKVTLNFEGEDLSEDDASNPFLNYRLNVTFKHKNKTYIVPGFYAADGNSAETSATAGKVWQVRFMPDEVGEWQYKVSFRKGENIAVSHDVNAGVSASFDGASGKFTIAESGTNGSHFQVKGRLKYDGTRYLKYTDSNEPFLKGGADSPESFLAYYEFDQTPPSHKYEAHAKDWKQGDPTWQNSKGKNIIGALNYLASKGMNSVYFLTMNVQGDGKDVWPWNNENERYRFDCSKLDQWEVVFDHMDDLGLMLHIVTQETENELLLDIGELKTQRKLYYRELIARFSHHLGVTWNLGEENGWQPWTPKAQSDDDRKAMAKYIKTQDPYKNLVVLHTHAVPKAQDLFLNPLLGYEYLDGPSMQTHHPHEVHHLIVKWINDSKKSGKQWVVCQDEIGPADTGAKPDADDPSHDDIRYHVLWGNLMAGGAGVEWYFGYKFAHNDLKCEDWRSRDILWDQTRHALEFFKTHVPFENMFSANGLTDNGTDYVLAEHGNTYVVYLPEVKETKINLLNTKNKFSIKWYNPRTGGALHKGSLTSVKGGGMRSIGLPPDNSKDWVALIVSKNKAEKQAAAEEKVWQLKAIKDFELLEDIATYYIDKGNGALAINAANKAQRDIFATARTVFKGKSGVYKGFLKTMTENDGESIYRVLVNGDEAVRVENPKTKASFENVTHDIGLLVLNTGDIIQVQSKAVTNGEIPENDETAWSRGRWNSLELSPKGLMSNKNEQLKALLKDKESFQEKSGKVEVEAEAFHHKSANNSPREWYVISKTEQMPFQEANFTNHSNSASGNAYLEALPDTRVTHDDDLIVEENFFPIPGVGGTVSYKINFATPGKYYVWVKAFSTGSEDNGLHVGLDGEWPESGARMQWCKGKNQWTWSSAQRTEEQHCGVPQHIFLNISEAGDHIVTFSMREDGFEFDKFILASDPNFKPE